MKVSTPLVEFIINRRQEKEKYREEKKEERRRKEIEKKKQRELERTKRKENKVKEVKGPAGKGEEKATFKVKKLLNKMFL
jgi:regulator of nonsense transcripts 3